MKTLQLPFVTEVDLVLELVWSLANPLRTSLTFPLAWTTIKPFVTVYVTLCISGLQSNMSNNFKQQQDVNNGNYTVSFQVLLHGRLLLRLGIGG